MPDYAIIVVSASVGISKMMKEHFKIAQALKIPICIVVTKVDIVAPGKLKETVSVLEKFLRKFNVRKYPVQIGPDTDLGEISEQILFGLKICPIFSISNFTG